MISIDSAILAADLDAFVQQFTAAIEHEALSAVEQMATAGRDNLHQLDEDAGHPILSGMWTYEAESTADGAEAEVFSMAEDITFFNASGPNRVQSTAYPIPGKRLLAILEGGAEEHDIFAGTVTDAKMLTIPGGSPAGSGLWRKHLASHRVALGKDFSTPFAQGIGLTDYVGHPGVTGDEHVKLTGEFLLEWSDSLAEVSAQRIADQF